MPSVDPCPCDVVSGTDIVYDSEGQDERSKACRGTDSRAGICSHARHATSCEVLKDVILPQDERQDKHGSLSKLHVHARAASDTGKHAVENQPPGANLPTTLALRCAAFDEAAAARRAMASLSQSDGLLE